MRATPDISTANDNKNAALAFDYGKRRIGVAFANRATGTATALTTVANRNTNELDRALSQLFGEWAPDVIVIGVPYNMDGSDSALAVEAIDFAGRLAKKFELPVDRVDERLTSAEASAMLREQRQSGLRRRKVRREDIDSLAAQLIADSWLRQD